jgi:hypothetical protein
LKKNVLPGTPPEPVYGKFPDLFILCSDVDATLIAWDGHEIVRIYYRYPKPHTMLAVIITEEEIRKWQEKENGVR